MDIGFAVRSDFLTRKGGDSVQLLNTMKYLESDFGARCTIVTSPEKLKEKRLDVVHIFNMQPQTIDSSLAYAEMAKALGMKIALSPIYWRLDESFINGALARKGIIDAPKVVVKLATFVSKLLFRDILKKKNFFSRELFLKADKLLQYSDIVLPNSPEEESILKKTLPNATTSNKKWGVIPNAVDAKKFFKVNEQPKQLPDNLKILERLSGKYVLCVARVEQLKNQLRILKALNNHPEIPIVLVGSTKGDSRYVESVKSYAKKRGNTYFIGEVSQQDMAFVYSNAAVHILPSFQESAGLATIEALFCEIPVVTSTEYFCPINFYRFNEFGFQCNPYRLSSVKKAILSAMQNKKDHVGKDYRSFFSYKNAANSTYKAYSTIV